MGLPQALLWRVDHIRDATADTRAECYKYVRRICPPQFFLIANDVPVG